MKELLRFHIVDDCGLDINYYSFPTKEEAIRGATNLMCKQLTVHNTSRRRNLYVIEGDINNTSTWKDIQYFIKNGIIQKRKKEV